MASLPVIDPDDLGDDRPRADAGVHGVVLAAGTSDRYGDRNKLLVAPEGEPIVSEAVRPLLEADLDGVTVVIGHEAERIKAALGDFAVRFVENDRYRDGQGASVDTAVAAARDASADAVLVALGDMPDVSPRSIHRLIDAYRADAGSALAAACDGHRGNPVLFDRQHFDALSGLDGNRGGRTVLLSAPDAALVDTGDSGVLQDVDRPRDH